ncbi:thioredoxin domain-containing protein 5 homolog [Drosophila grimshawi]|uniref:GH24386 n=1 Tax=Drosophila grimshawi TaxID=7222 RepID=B4JM73_DROGR|nr:thioredoxin domain-containing protein 5 homolog [Drosophila grimshawi]EDV91834.1 GH24386 [Drosophila grimshawi]
MLFKSIVPLLCAACALSISPYLARAATDEEQKQTDQKQFAIELDPETFDEVIGAGNVFVKFFAPWCGHCKRLHPLWEQLAEIMNIDEPKVKIAKVDCTKHQTLCADHQVTGYPTLRLFKLGETESVRFKGTRDLPAITDFINQELNTPASEDLSGQQLKDEQNPNLGKVVELTEDTFAKHVSSGNHFVKFFAPWCSHCQHLAPTWEELANALVKEPAATISKIDCTQYRSICQDFEVKGYPTLLWIEDGKKIEKYAGARDLATLKTYVEKMIGAPSGSNDVNDATKDALDATKKQTVLQLNGKDEFEQATADGITFIKFYAPWCGHCQKLQPTWEQLATEALASDAGISVAKVDCTSPDNRQICIDQQVEGYPTLFLYKNGQRQNEYEGSRSLPELQAYIKKFIGHDEL